jgi:mannan endo-1,4-beta-mannosidase
MPAEYLRLQDSEAMRIYINKVATAVLALLMAVPAMGVSRRPAIRLINRLAALQKQGVMIGHQDDPVYGCSWKWDEGRSDVKEVCGDYPAVMGFDLGDIELGKDCNLDGVPFDRMRREIVAQHRRGGIVTLSWHANNPATDGNAWDASGDAVGKILPGGKLHNKFNGWLKTVAQFIASLRTSDGKQIPVVFRPWHEMSGSWFWWGDTRCTTEQYKRLYRYTYEYLTGCGCRNIVWAYSPNLADQTETVDHYEQFYPGDDVVDLLGIDIYQREPDNAQYQKWLRSELDVVKQVGAKRRKLIALTETGYNDVPDPKWFTQVLLPVLREYPLCYVLLWRNAWDKPEENYIAAPGKVSEADFRCFHADGRTLFVNDIAGTAK